MRPISDIVGVAEWDQIRATRHAETQRPVWPHFIRHELSCSHCGECWVDLGMMAALEIIRIQADRPIEVISGYRCPGHPIEAAKAQAGAHAMGCAVDVRTDGRQDQHDVMQAALSLGASGVGVAEDGGMLHLDWAPTGWAGIRPGIWTYRA